MSETGAATRGERRSLPVGFSLLAGVLAAASVGIAVLRHGPIAALPEDAAPDRFSAARAVAVLEELLAERVPHPVGSPENARVRDRIRARFAGLGIATELQRVPACSAYGECATVENILARIPGREAGPAPLDGQVTMRKGQLDELPNRMNFSGGKDKVIRHVVPQDAPHALDIVARMAPIPLGVQVAEIESFLLAERNSRDRTGDLAGDEGFAPNWAFMIE